MSDNQEQTQQKVNSKQQGKSNRKRRILMKQKCNFINHQIQLNISKLDEMMNTIKTKREQQQSAINNKLSTINQDEQTQSNESNTGQQKKQVRKQRRLKFKYSILRQYEFDQQQSKTQQQQLNNSMIIMYKRQQSKTFTEQLTRTQSLREGNNQQQQLLQGFNEHAQQQQQQSLKYIKLQSKVSSSIMLNHSEFTINNEIQSIRIQTRYDWISSYLDNQIFRDTIIKGRSQNNEVIEVLRFNKKQDIFQCRLLVVQEQENQNIYNSEQHIKDTLQIEYNYNQFIQYNPQIEIYFPQHTQNITIIQSQIKQVIKLNLPHQQNQSKSIRILVKSINKSNQYMQRIIIFKKLPSTNSNDQKYKIVWTKYDKMSFVQDVVLQTGCNYLVTNLCCNPSSQVSLIFNPKDIENVKIHKTKYDPWKSYNILCSSFQQCSKVFMSQNVFDDSKPLEFLRSNFLDYGLVLEIYQNIYNEKAAYFDEKQNASEIHEEDIQLLFPEIYTPQQNQNVYLPQELVIKFFEVTQKPARLYFPQKKILIGSKIAEHVTIHSTFK